MQLDWGTSGNGSSARTSKTLSEKHVIVIFWVVWIPRIVSYFLRLGSPAKEINLFDRDEDHEHPNFCESLILPMPIA